MKKIYTSSLLIFIIGVTFSCKKDKMDTPIPNPNQNTSAQPPANPPSVSSSSKYLIIDSARIFQISETGTNEQLILNRTVNTSSYIRDLSIGADGNKFIYTDIQNIFDGTTYVSTQQIRLFDLDKKTDIALLSTTTEEIFSIRYCQDGKIFYGLRNTNSYSKVFGTINEDGTGKVENVAFYYNVEAVSNDRRFLLLMTEQTPTNQKMTIVDRNSDNGAGGVYHNELFEGTDKIDNGVFTADGKKVIITYRVADEVKIRILDLETKTSRDKTIVTGLSEYNYTKISMSHDSNKGALTISGQDYQIKSKVFVFKLDDSIVTSFDTPNKSVKHAFIY